MLSEWRKTGSKKNVVLLVVVLGINLFFLTLYAYGPGAETSPQIYREVFREMDGMSNQEKYEYLKENSVADIPDGTVQDYKKRLLTEEMAESAKTIAYYENYLADTEKSLGKKLGISLFGDENSFAQRNAKKMQKAYRALHGIPVRFESYKAIELADMTVTNILTLFLVLFISAESLIAEKEEGLLTLLRSCKRGRGWLMRNKLLSLTISILLLSGVFLTENLLFGMAVYGAGNLARPLQSLPGYEGCPWKISVLAFLAGIWILRAFGLMLASVFVLLLTVGTYQMVRVLGEGMLAGGVCYFLYTAIGLSSGLVILHYVNPAAFLAAAPLIKGEINLNIMGFPVKPLVAAVPAGIAGYLGFTAWLFRRFDKNREERPLGVRLGRRGRREKDSPDVHLGRRGSRGKHVILQLRRRRKRGCSASVGAGEAYKLLVTGKGAVLLLVMLGVQIFLYPGRTYVAPPEEIYERYCMRRLQGEIGEEQTQWLEMEQERLRSKGDSVQMELQVMESWILPLSGHLNRVKEEGGEARYMEQIGYEKLFGTGERAADRKNTMLYVLLLLCTVSPYLAMEKTTNMIALIRPTKTGWRKVRSWKRRMVIFFSSVSLPLLWLPDWVWILRTYHVKDWNAPLIWLYEFRETGVPLTIGAYAGLLLIIRLMGGAVIGLLMCLVSEKSRNGIEAYGINAILFFVPTVLAVLGVPYVEQYTCSALLDGNWILRRLM